MCDNHTSKDCQDLLYHNDTTAMWLLSKECKDLWHHNDATNLFNHPRVIRAALRESVWICGMIIMLEPFTASL